MAPKINKLAPIQIVAPKINKMAPKIDKLAPIQILAPKINKLAPKINKMAPIQIHNKLTTTNVTLNLTPNLSKVPVLSSNVSNFPL